jgi:hypothetical protein
LREPVSLIESSGLRTMIRSHSKSNGGGEGREIGFTIKVSFERC